MNRFYTPLILMLLLLACQSEEKGQIFVVTNSLSHDRTNEVVSISKELIRMETGQSLENFGVSDELGTLLLIQYADNDQDGTSDEILFQPKVTANGQAKFNIKLLGKSEKNPENENICFSRFVPERTDDYAWENDKVAFRTFGPTAQKMKEEGVPGGTLTSGIDCWLKKVEYPIINSWYKKFESDPNAYHIDTGEGLDNFHVGISRGCGGLAVKRNEEFHTSKNFISYETRSNGYMRTSFALNYAPWFSGDSAEVALTQHISLDRGSQLSKYVVQVSGTDELSAGLTLHENDGQITIDSLGGWISYYQPHGDSYLAMALVASPGTFSGSEKIVTDEKDLSHVYMHVAVQDGKAEYYAGFSWLESGQFEDEEAWFTYLTRFSAQIKKPLDVAFE